MGLLKKYWKYLVGLFVLLAVVGLIAIYAFFWFVGKDLPKIDTLNDYKPKKVSQVYDRHGKKIGEFFYQRRVLVDMEKIPKPLIQAFIAAEDSAFYEHDGVNYKAILRAMIANLKAGRTVQGASTITQQVAKQLLLSPKRDIMRKIKEAILSRRMEKAFSKEQILYLYLNEIYFGEGAYGVQMAAETYFQKDVSALDIHECAMLAALPKFPGSASPIKNPPRAKLRQKYVLNRMGEEGFITKEEALEYQAKELRVYSKRNEKALAPYFMEAVRLALFEELGQEQVLNEGLNIYTSLDAKKQKEANTAVEKGLRELDKRQVFRGPLEVLSDDDSIRDFLAQTIEKWVREKTKYKTILEDGKVKEVEELASDDSLGIISTRAFQDYPEFLKGGDIVKGVVVEVSDKLKITKVLFGPFQGIIPFSSMEWARTPNSEVGPEQGKIKKPSKALKKGDVVYVKVIHKDLSRVEGLAKSVQAIKSQFMELELEQEPLVEAALLSFDQKTEDIVAMVGGRDFKNNEFNRTFQSIRQTGSAFKPIVYAAAMDQGYTPSSVLLDIPLILKEGEGKKYKPENYSKKFRGKVPFRKALILSLNIPTIRLIQDIKVKLVSFYARWMGIYNPLNEDITMALGSNGTTLYEMTKVYSMFGRLGKRVKPKLIHKVENEAGEEIFEEYNFDKRFAEKMAEAKEKLEKELTNSEKYSSLFNLQNDDQVLNPQVSYLTTTLLKGVVQEGTATSAAKVLKRPAAGKTGTTNDSYDAWFIGYTPNYVAGVWVGFDTEKTLGRGEAGGKAALPIWTQFMDKAHIDVPIEEFDTPKGIIFAKIDKDSGMLASESTEKIINQAFVEGTEPTEMSEEDSDEDEQLFWKQDISQ